MNLWIDIARDALVKVIERVDCLILNDAELRQLTGKPSLVGGRARGHDAWARRSSWPSRASTAPRCSRGESFFSLPAYPLETVVDPTGRRGHVRRRLRRAHRPQPRAAATSERVLRQAVAYGTALASYNVEEFGTERVARLTAEEIQARVASLQGMTQFESDAVLTVRP